MEKNKYCNRKCSGAGKHDIECPYSDLENKILAIANEYAKDGCIIPLKEAISNLLTSLN